MATSVNKVILLGNLVRDAELRYTQSNNPVLNFVVATNKSWQKQDGTWEEAAEFHRCAMFGDFAQRMAPRLVKGGKVYVEGEISTKKWTGRDGSEREDKQILVRQVVSLTKTERRDDADPPQPDRNDGPERDDGIPF